MVRFKVLECPKWIKSNHFSCKETLERNYYRDNPLFYRDGLYLLNNSNILIEYDGKAWAPKDQESSIRQFHRDLKWTEYEGVHILSYDQINAIRTLLKVGIASDKQMEMYSAEYSRRKAKAYRKQLLARVKLCKALTMRNQDILIEKAKEAVAS
jgi:hypothetical protein